MEDQNTTKKEILKGLVFSREDTLDRLKDLVNKSKSLMGIEQESGKIIIIKADLPLKEKVILLLIGKYFAKELGFIDSEKVSVNTLRKELMVESRALSRPIGDLIKENMINKEEDEYSIKHYQIENCINRISEAKQMPLPTVKKARKRRLPKSKKEEHPEEKKLIDGSIRELANKLAITEEDLKHIFEFGETDVRIIAPIEGKSESQRQLNATLLYLTIYKYCFNLKEIKSSELRRKLVDLGIRSLVNLSTNLNQNQSYIWHRMDQRGDTTTSYRITTPGEIEGLRIIKEMKKRLEEKLSNEEEQQNGTSI